MKRAWYRFQDKADDPTVAELIIFGSIGASWWDDDAVSAKSFMDDLKALPAAVAKIVVRVNSLGGDVFDGLAIANALRDQIRSKGRKVTTIVDGIAASAASVVIMAGEAIQVSDNGLIMVHQPYTIEIGNAAQMRKTADALDKVQGTIVATYKWHSSLGDDAIVALLEAETWMSADEAIANGFATEKIEGLKAAASLDKRALAKLTIPEQYRAQVDALVLPTPAPPPAPVAAAAADVLRLCADANLDLVFARSLIDSTATLEQVTARVTTEKTARAEAKVRADAIRAICATAKQPELADGYISGAMTTDAVRQHITVITAKLDKVEIDGGLLPEQGTRVVKGASTREIYAERNRRTAH